MSPLDDKEDFAPGVQLHKGLDADSYIGHVSALLAAGLVKPEEMPGTTPGLPARSVVFFADDPTPRDGRYGGPRRKAAGEKHIHLLRKGICSLRIYVDKTEATRRFNEALLRHARKYGDQGGLPSLEIQQQATRAGNVIDFAAYKARNVESRRVQW
ncbi:hypothetical protein ACHMW6_15420 [Pseudoduganella sp. UC29_106]|uniref:hypothetical protein n=1 Tax=Pseudoduganella sp. UC29_106 TaxID=3374553 RepID=UPI003756A51C